MTSPYFILTYILCLLFILFDISYISTDIQKGTIQILLGKLFICIGSSIISTYSQKFENQFLIYTSNFIYKYDSF